LKFVFSPLVYRFSIYVIIFKAKAPSHKEIKDVTGESEIVRERGSE